MKKVTVKKIPYVPAGPQTVGYSSPHKKESLDEIDKRQSSGHVGRWMWRNRIVPK